MSNDFNPKCNQSTGAGTLSPGFLSCAEAAEQAMQRHAAYRAEQKAFEEAKHRAKEAPNEQPVRWLQHSDTAG